MDFEELAFPALIVADDGWVQYVGAATSLARWTPSAIRSYNKRRVVAFDKAGKPWLIESIAPRQRRHVLLRLVDPVWSNPRITARILLSAMPGDAVQILQDALLVSIDADDDILTQWEEADELRQQVLAANSFSSVLNVLRSAQII
jgi:hypothetical protein